MVLGMHNIVEGLQRLHRVRVGWGGVGVGVVGGGVSRIEIKNI